MKYDAVIFDLYGTLVDFVSNQEFREVRSDIANTLGAPADGFLRVWLESLEERMLNRFGGIEGTLRYVCSSLGAQPGDRELQVCVVKCINATRREMTPRPGVIDTLGALKRMGLRLGLVSDCSLEVSMIWPETEFASLVDAPVFSCVEEVVKPSPRLFTAVCDRLRVRPDRCLYVGDGGGHELTGAYAFGMHPVLVRVDYDHHVDHWRPDALRWDGPRIAAIPDVLPLVQGQVGPVNLAK